MFAQSCANFMLESIIFGCSARSFLPAWSYRTQNLLRVCLCGASRRSAPAPQAAAAPAPAAPGRRRRCCGGRSPSSRRRRSSRPRQPSRQPCPPRPATRPASQASRAPFTRPWPTPTPCSSRASPDSRAHRIPTPRRRPPPRRPTNRSCRSSITSVSCGRACSGRSSQSRSPRRSGFYFATDIRKFLQRPLGDIPLQVLGVGDAFVIQVKIALVVGIILAMPILLYQLWAFIAPGLTPNERKVIRPWIPMALFFFALGVVDRLCRPAVRDPVPVQLHRRRPPGSSGGRPVLRLRDDDVPGVRPRHGVPDPARRAVDGRHRHLGAAHLARVAWSSSASRSSPRS